MYNQDYDDYNYEDQDEYNYQDQFQQQQFYEPEGRYSDYDDDEQTGINNDEIQDYSLGFDFQEQNEFQEEIQNHYSQRQALSHPYSPYSYNFLGFNRQQSIDNNVQAKYGKQMKIKKIQYGFLHQNQYYKFSHPNKKGYQFPSGGRIKFRQLKEGSNVLEITDNKSYKIQIKISQIQKVISFPGIQIICICYNFPPQYYVNSQKDFVHFRNEQKQTQALLKVYQSFILQKMAQKPHWRPFWKRILNIPLYSLDQKYPNQTFMENLLVKRGAIYLHLQNFTTAHNIIAEELHGFKQIERSDLEKQVLDHIIHTQYNQVLKLYSVKRFSSFFDFPAITKRQKIQKYEIMFSLMSFLYTCKEKVGIQDIFLMAEIIQQQIKINNQCINTMWRSIKFLPPTSLETVMFSQEKKEKLRNIIQERIQIVKTKGKKQFGKEDINENAITVPLLKITPSGLLPSGWSTDLRNRLVRHYKQYDYQFMKIQILDDNGEKGSFCMFDDIFRSEINRKMAKIQFLGRSYIPLGWTQSQLKKASMWFTLQKADIDFLPRQQLLFFLGDFNHIKNPALKAARTGQNLSTGMSINVKDANVQLQQDDKSGKHMYTDGIGMISFDLIERIQKQLNKQATVYQVRFQGSKGILALNRQLPQKTIILRQSMKKFECPCPEARVYLDILDCSYHKTGYLNRQIIILLQQNGVNISNFIELQMEYMQRIVNLQETIDEEGQKNFEKSFNGIIYNEKKNNEFKIESIGEVLGMIKKSKSLDVLKEPILRRILCEKYRGMFEKLVKKSHIKVEKSARILGIIDEYGILQENQVYCTINKKQANSQKQMKQNISGKVMLTRNPCMHPSDIRVVNCISKQEASKRFDMYTITNLFENLPNCVIFPKAGIIPLTAQISGSDLDGDTFFITWDPRLIPEKSPKPYIADDVKPKQREWGGSGYPQILKFFTEFISNDNLGKIGNSHLAKADKEGARSKDCLQLCEAYNKAVDYPKKGYKFEFQKHFKPRQYPHFMQKYDKKSYHSKTALGRVYNSAKDHYDKFVQKVQKKNIKIPFIPKFLAIKYQEKQIRYAIECVLNFNNQIRKILNIYQFRQESQIYALSKNKENKDKLLFLSELQLKFFRKFFSGLDLPCSPEDYYETIRELNNYSSKNEKIAIQVCIQQRLLLWYHVLYHNSFFKYQTNVKWQRWLYQLHNIENKKGIKLSEKAQHIGLLWFSVPCIAFIVLKHHYSKD